MQQTEKNCFIITPIGNNDSQTRRNTDGLINTVLRPLLEKDFNFQTIVAAHEINASGSINNQIMKKIIYDDLVIANLTGVNPNVMYEVAVRHATRKPIIHICEEGTKLPFDIIDQRTIFYKNDMLGVKELKTALTSMIKEALKEKQSSDNPIYNATQSKIFIDSIADKPEKNFEKYLLERFESLETRIMSLKSAQRDFSTIHSEPFVIRLTSKEKLDEGLFYTELKSNLQNEKSKLSYFNINNIEKIKSEYQTVINIVLENEVFVPTREEIINSLKNIRFNNLESFQVEGNDVPF
ncbi:hypothetical protein OQ279_01475 [Salinimicrobium sp. MT39]|uniref:Nucleoside 2-deoxyribosyltransferase n=1 Tax=Salinimicrobium profundisediminis TaxID=2994553 RepID=A0A9X3CU07_9FLAO|nr:hypothetical protein [Salinimicrobium profundisediminis]MCX2836807.1 hypothetical protein [Salinimicrobium profundisediminis]